jgi:hypothetical protein
LTSLLSNKTESPKAMSKSSQVSSLEDNIM